METYILLRQTCESRNCWPCVFTDCLPISPQETTHSTLSGICQQEVESPKKVFWFVGIRENRVVNNTKKKEGTTRRAIFEVTAEQLDHGGDFGSWIQTQNGSPNGQEVSSQLYRDPGRCMY